MADSPITRVSLLIRLRDGADHVAWTEFLDSYGPMLYRFVRSRGLQDADAADIVQDVMRRVGSSIGKLEYEKAKGGFRAWLFTITRNCLYSYFGKRQNNHPNVNDTAQFELLSAAPDHRNELNDAWEDEYRRQLASKAMIEVETQVEPKTWQAFYLTSIDGLSATEAGKRLELSTGAIYVAKSRVIAKLRSAIERLQEEE